MEIGQGNLDQVRQESNPSVAATDGDRFAEDFDQFLLLLTTQLKNQDPTEPLDVNQFTNQLVAFTGVEQQIKTNENLEALVAEQTSRKFDSAVNYIGLAVDALGNTGELANGQGTFAYELDGTAANATVIISDVDGNAVFRGNGSTFNGKNIVAWDGVNSFNGRQMPDGTYLISVAATDSRGNQVTSRPLSTGIVTGIENDGENELKLLIGQVVVPIEDVRSVRVPTLQDVGPQPQPDDEAASDGGETTDEEEV